MHDASQGAGRLTSRGVCNSSPTPSNMTPSQHNRMTRPCCLTRLDVANRAPVSAHDWVRAASNWPVDLFTSIFGYNDS